MDFSHYLKLDFWNNLATGHLTELIMILTAAILVMLDRYVRKSVTKFTKSFNVISRFGVFLLVCSAGYAVLALGVARALKLGILFNGGLYAAPMVLALLFVIAIEAQRQKHI
ncbi:MAG: DUF3392 family protein [Deltaproteobacteria bacterium]|nr:DUF3392 family protein [Deltaproteobacteria bacterium]